MDLQFYILDAGGRHKIDGESFFAVISENNTSE